MKKITLALSSVRNLLSSPQFMSVLCALSASLVLIQSARLASRETALRDLSSSAESRMEKIHAMGYESGYQSAIVDAYTESARYLIEEDTSGQPVMWKKIEIEEPNRSLLLSRLSEVPTSDLSASTR